MNFKFLKIFLFRVLRVFRGRKADPRAQAVDRIFAEEDGAGENEPRDAAEAVFAEVYAEVYTESLPDGKKVDRLLSRKKSLSEVLQKDEKGGKNMKLIVGLGNPGAKYVGTRHNVGYEILAELARRHGSGSVKTKFQGEILEGNIAGQKVVFLSPITYMNLSGRSVRPCFDFYKIEKTDLLILCDDVNLPLGKIRVRVKGSAGGQKGLADIIRVMGGDDVSRLRVGVDEPPAGRDLADYVLSKFTAKERELMNVAVMTAADAVELWVLSGIDRCMEKYNGR